jgi:hypothetical protein
MTKKFPAAFAVFFLVLLLGQSQIAGAQEQAPHRARVRTYFIAADEVVWDYAPLARDEAYVESKFGTAGLTAAQRAAANALGDAYQVERWGYPFFSRIGGYLGFGYGAAGSMAGRNCGCN